MTLSDFLRMFKQTEQTADGWLVNCPAHADSQASLRITVSDARKVLLKCRAGCDTRDVVKALDLTLRDLATMDPGDVVLTRTATSTVPASPAAIAALAVQLDGYAANLAEATASALRNKTSHP